MISFIFFMFSTSSSWDDCSCFPSSLSSISAYTSQCGMQPRENHLLQLKKDILEYSLANYSTLSLHSVVHLSYFCLYLHAPILIFCPFFSHKKDLRYRNNYSRVPFNFKRRNKLKPVNYLLVAAGKLDKPRCELPPATSCAPAADSLRPCG